jgi:hypothetical protein
MGLFDRLFGGKNEPEPAPKKKIAEPAAPIADAATPAVAAIEGGSVVPPEIVAAIAASIAMMDDTSISAELLAAITAAVVHHSGGGVHAVRIKHGSNAWALSGRQKIMDSRQFA